MIEAATGLFATMPVDEVTVQDIATAVEMTPAAVYYHFASKEQILIEGMERFRTDLLGEVRDHQPRAGDANGLSPLLEHLLAWTAARRTSATVYFVSSIGLNMMVEALRRETRLELIEELRTAVVAVRGRLSRAESGVIAVGLVSLLETSIASMLNQDATFRGLGVKKFSTEVQAIGDRIAGVTV